MKLTAVICTGLLALLATPCHAETEFHGVLSSGAHTVFVDTAFVNVPPLVIDTFPTPGWQADSTAAVDSFDFPNISSWPNLVELAVRVDGVTGRQHVLGPMPGVWFLFQGILPPAPGVMFWALSGIESPAPIAPGVGFTVEPSVLSSRVRFGFAGNGTAGKLVIYDAAGNCVRTFTTGRDAWTATWAGDDDIGSQLPNGAYFCRLTAGSAAATAKVLVAR